MIAALTSASQNLSAAICELGSAARRRTQNQSSSVFVTLEMLEPDACVLRSAETHRWTKERGRIFDATKRVGIPTKSLTLRTVTRVIWLSRTRVSMDTPRGARSRFRFCFETIECAADEQKIHTGVSAPCIALLVFADVQGVERRH